LLIFLSGGVKIMRPPGLMILWFASLGTSAGTTEESTIDLVSLCERVPLEASDAMTFSLKAAIPPRDKLSEASDIFVEPELDDTLEGLRESGRSLPFFGEEAMENG
jgi:hypothetical protein